MSDGPADVRQHLRNWAAIYILAALFVGSWLGQWFTQLAEYSAEQADHGQPFEWSGFFAAFLSATFENWQSEFLQLVVQALLISAFSHVLFRRGDEDRARLERKVDAIQHHLVAMQQFQPDPPPPVPADPPPWWWPPWWWR